MTKRPIFPGLVLWGGVMILVAIWGLIFRDSLMNNPEYVRKNIEKTLPTGAFLRDYVKLEGAENKAYLVLYIDKGYTEQKKEPETMMSCPGEIIGQPIKGYYHLGLFENNMMLNEVAVPYANQELSLVHLNIKGNIYNNFDRTDKYETEAVPLLVLKDYTGDGKPYEFLLKTSEGGCGFWDGLVAGYDPETNRAMIFSDWIHNFNPDNKGYFHYLFDCGNHGNETRVEEDYQYFPLLKKFVKTGEKSASCNA